jgi:hypothetical protein
VLARHRQDFQLLEREKLRISKTSPNKATAESQITFKPHITEKSERLGDSSLKNKLKDFKGSHADYLIGEAMRIKVERECLAQQKEAEEVKRL